MDMQTAGPLLAAFPELLGHGRNMASLSYLYRYYFGTLLYSQGSCTGYSDRFYDFSVTIPRCSKDVYINSFFPLTARLCLLNAFLWPMVQMTLHLELRDTFYL